MGVLGNCVRVSHPSSWLDLHRPPGAFLTGPIAVGGAPLPVLPCTCKRGIGAILTSTFWIMDSTRIGERVSWHILFFSFLYLLVVGVTNLFCTGSHAHFR